MSALTLPGDGAPTGQAVGEHLAVWAGTDPQRQAVAAIVAAVTAAAAPLAYRLARGELPGDPKRIVGTNTVGDKQKALDVASHTS